jgi:hypothetical protein
MDTGFAADLGYGRVLHPLGGVVGAVRDGRLAKTDSDLVKALEIAVRQVGIPLPDIVDRLVHPLTLIIFGGCEDSAAIDVTEQLVTRPI